MTRGSIFVPNISCGPCLYCNKISDSKPEDLLRCDICKRSAHFSCLKCGTPKSRLLGDNFYHFTCAECSPQNNEIITRIKLSFIQSLLLSLYNLHVSKQSESNDGYFHYRNHIQAFILSKWDDLYCYDGTNYYKDKNKLVPSCISGQLSQCHLFTSKKIEKGRGGWYRLTSLEAPAMLLKTQQIPQRKRALPNDTDSIPEEIPPTKISKTNNNEFSSSSSTSSFSSASSTSSLSSVATVLKEEAGEDTSSVESVDESSRGSWFRDWVKPEAHLPPNIFADEEDLPLDVEDTSSTPVPPVPPVAIKSSSEDSLPEPVEGGRVVLRHSSLFTHSKPTLKPPEDDLKRSERNVPLSYYEERKLLNKLDLLQNLTPELYRLRRKLKVRQVKREHNLPLFNIDAEVKFVNVNGRLMSHVEKKTLNSLLHDVHTDTKSLRILDRFQVPERHTIHCKTEDTTFKARLLGVSGDNLEFIHSPYSLREMKPFIFRDFMTVPPKLKLLRDILHYGRCKRGGSREDAISTPQSIDYCYVTPKHIPAMNHLAREFFWPGIDLSEVLHYPEFTCVVLCGHLVIGFGVIVPDTSCSEAYVSFLFVHPEWRRAGIAKFILYHLIQTCSGKDITLHVSATNPALIMYQQFGFKVEEFLADFYDKYLPEDSPQCKHAMFLRLRR